MDAHELREAFLRFFEERGHRRVPSAPIVPAGDPTLLFTSAGMVQFKPYFMGQARSPHTRLASVQKCFRTSDIESVGDTSHLTFFEMLGNFSIGDYFKAEIIPWAWEFVTEVLHLQKDRLWTAVYLDDDEAYSEWRKAGMPPERIVRYGEEDNYWFSGDVGPCGPCSEIYYDFGEQFGCEECEPNHECGRFLEIWNLVFMSFYCDGDARTPLPANNIDTGSGLERVSAALLYETPGWDKDRLPSVYDTDLFAPLIKKIEELSAKRYGADHATDRAIRILAEHARAVTFLIGDERTPVPPSNEERGYVVRRMLRRALYFARRKLGISEPVMGMLADTVVDYMSASYPELEHQRGFINDILGPEERRFDETLSRGLDMLDDVMGRSPGGIPGENAFALHDTYGFPIELTREIAAENGLTVDEAGFEAEMDRQRERARSATKLRVSGKVRLAGKVTGQVIPGGIETQFVGYETLESRTRISALLLTESGRADRVNTGQEAQVFLAETPFYPEGGGQVGDRGEIRGRHGVMRVEDTQRVDERLIAHRGPVTEGWIADGDEVIASVDPQHRADTMRNHTATHLLHAALRKVLGTHVRQAGSLVGPDYLRFDFTHTEALTGEQIAAVESMVNGKIREDLPVQTRTTSFDEAMREEGVLKFFGDKYGAEVRVVEVNSVVPRFSAELCGGTHCRSTGQVGAVIITGEASIGSGMRRIEALSGRGAEEYVRGQRQQLADAARLLSATPEELAEKADALLIANDAMRRVVDKLAKRWAELAAKELSSLITEVHGIRMIIAQPTAEDVTEEGMLHLGDAIRDYLTPSGGGLAVLGYVVDGKPRFLAIVTRDLVKRGLHAGNLLKKVAAAAGGGGGGRPDMAQGGGKDVSKIGEALGMVPEAVREMLGGN